MVRRFHVRAGLTAAVLAVFAATAAAGLIAVHPVMTPVGDLSDWLEQYIQRHPDNAEAAYRLGRVHYIAGVLKLEKIGLQDSAKTDPAAGELDAHASILLDQFEPGRPVHEPWGMVGLVVYDTDTPLERDSAGNLWGGGITAKAMSGEAVEAHLHKAVELLRQAVKAEPKNARYHLALACALEDEAKLAVKPTGHPAHADPPAEATRKEMIAEYLRAYELAIKHDQGLAYQPLHGLHSIISYDAGKNYFRLAAPSNDPDAPHDPAQDAKAREVRDNLKQLEQLKLPMID